MTAPRFPSKTPSSKNRPLSLASLPIWKKLQKLRGLSFFAAFESFAREKNLNPALPGLWLALAELASSEGYLPQALLAAERTLALLQPSLPSNAEEPAEERAETSESSASPDIAAIQLFYAKLLLRSGQLDAAAPLLGTLHQTAPSPEVDGVLLSLFLQKGDASGLIALGKEASLRSASPVWDLAHATGLLLRGDREAALPLLRASLPSLFLEPPHPEPWVERILFSGAAAFLDASPSDGPLLLPFLWKRPVPSPEAWSPLLFLALRFSAWTELPRLASQAPPALVSSSQARFFKALASFLQTPVPPPLSSLPPKLLSTLSPAIFASLPDSWRTTLASSLAASWPELLTSFAPPEPPFTPPEPPALPARTSFEKGGAGGGFLKTSLSPPHVFPDKALALTPGLSPALADDSEVSAEAKIFLDTWGAEVWRGLPAICRRLLCEGEHWLSLLKEGRDHSPILLQASRAVEEALNRKLLDPFVTFAEERLGLRAEKDLPRLGGRWLQRTGNAITLGSIPYLLAEQWPRWELEDLLAEEPKAPSMLYNYQVTSAQRLLWESWKRKLRKEGHLEEMITFLFQEIPAMCQTWALIRNRVVHEPTPLERDDLLRLREKLLLAPKNLFLLTLRFGGSLRSLGL